jgi:hypothetical protein
MTVLLCDRRTHRCHRSIPPFSLSFRCCSVLSAASVSDRLCVLLLCVRTGLATTVSVAATKRRLSTGPDTSRFGAAPSALNNTHREHSRRRGTNEASACCRSLARLLVQTERHSAEQRATLTAGPRGCGTGPRAVPRALHASGRTWCREEVQREQQPTDSSACLLLLDRPLRCAKQLAETLRNTEFGRSTQTDLNNNAYVL